MGNISTIKPDFILKQRLKRKVCFYAQKKALVVKRNCLSKTDAKITKFPRNAHFIFSDFSILNNKSFENVTGKLRCTQKGGGGHLHT
jgi:hypothetical protein